MKTLSDLLALLTDAGIDFVVIGGFAGVLHGSTLVTRDLDLCTVLTPDNIDKLRDALKDLHPRHRMTPQKLPFLTNPPHGSPLSNLYLETDWGVVDFLSSVVGVGDFKVVRDRADTVEIAGRKIRMIRLDDLIRAKESMNRDKDRLAVKELKAIQAKRKG
jgi:predicted nucleotidyltransferase